MEYISTSGKLEWDCFYFVSHISGYSVQTITLNKKEEIVRFENKAYDEDKRVDILLTEELLNRFEWCIKDANIYDWAKVNYNPCADGEQWSFEFYKGDVKTLIKMGSNAYPSGYGRWLEFYSRLLKENGISMIYSCYKSEREGRVYKEQWN